MTQRKPRGVSFESWTERQLREARERGAFDDLPGTGRPLRAVPSDELAWLREKARREDLPVQAFLPPALAVAKEVEDLPARLARESAPARARALVEDLDARIDAARRAPQLGPPVRTARLDVEAVLAAWAAGRAELAAEQERRAAQAAAAAGPAGRRRRRWWPSSWRRRATAGGPRASR